MNEIVKLLSVVHSLELRELMTKMDIQKGKYIFPEPIALCGYNNGEPTIFKIVGIEVNVEEEYVDEFLFYVILDEEEHVIPEWEVDLCPGEIVRMAKAIPNEYVDPQEMDNLWSEMNGSHVVTDCDHEPVIVWFDNLNNSVCLDYAGTKHEWKGAKAQQELRRAFLSVMRMPEMFKTDSTKVQAIAQEFFNQAGLDLPF